MKPHTLRIAYPALLLVSLLLPHSEAHSRPYIILEGTSYYSDEYFQTGIVRDLVDEKNLEEVYQYYTYYEATYDAQDRIDVFREYKQGDIILEERYVYEGKMATPIYKTVLIPGKNPEVIHPDKEN